MISLSYLSGSVRASFSALLALCLVLVCMDASAASKNPAATRNGYEYYQIGDLNAPRPGHTEAALMLMGGGKWPNKAFAWFAAKGGHGHVVILRASGADEMQKELYTDIGGVASVQTLVFHSRAAASDPQVLDIVRHADGIFIAGGDQSNYVRFWKGTPLNVALNQHVAHGKPIGGTSAGLAILGGYAYGALDGGSMESQDALRHPLGKGMTLVDDFMHLPYLQQVITDTHFNARGRLGRLIGFVAKLRYEGHSGVVGLGVDQDAALCVDGNGIGRLFTINNGFAWLVRPDGKPVRIEGGKPLDYPGTRVTGIGTQSTIDLRDLSVHRPVFEALADARDGELNVHGEHAPVLVIHGGAGVERAGMTPQIEAKARAALELALRNGYAQLKSGKSAVDAVTAAITVLEDDPLFNAGKGAVFTHDGKNELDASIMDGSTLAAGAVAGVHQVRNPILLARAVMEHSPHVMMVGNGAETFATEQGFKLVDPSYFRTDRRWQELQHALKDDAAGVPLTERLLALKHFGTVGALARDSQGRLAAGTSTGGMTDKRYGRVGDSPIVGAGNYANVACAVSGTGWGEYYIRVSAAREICLRMTELNESAEQAGKAVINEEIPQMGGDGGAIILGADGSVSMPFNTEGMYRGWIGADGVPHVAIYGSDPLVLPSASR
ncbi:peptidase T [Rhodanobacter sp. B04]|nr:peptidase T [Rhodanobacter sp. B04]